MTCCLAWAWFRVRGWINNGAGGQGVSCGRRAEGVGVAGLGTGVVW